MKPVVASVLLVTAPLLASAEDYPAPVQAAIDQGVEVQSRFDAPGGLTGYAGHVQGQPVALYLLPDGEHVVVGTMLDAAGRNITAAQLDAHLPPPDLEPAWEQLEQATWVAEGPQDPDRIVYAFTDPNCPYCQKLWEAAQPYLEARNIQLRHVMVAILRPSSMGKAARILAAADPAAALAEQESSYAGGGLPPLQDIPPEVRRQINRNNGLMSHLGLRATPAVFYRDRQGRVRQLVGVPDQQTLDQEVFR